jgi:hypothetical protein
MSSLLYLKDCDLGPELAPRLAPFINAWRPHTRAPHDYELREAGYTRIEKETFVDELEEEYFEEHGYYPDENPELDNN